MLSDGDLTLRPFRQEDRDALAGLANNPNICKRLMDRFPSPYTLEAADRWLARVKFESELRNFAIEWRGQFVGGIGLEPLADIYRLTAEIGYWLGEPYWGNGLATRALGLVVGYAFSSLPYIRLQAVIFSENESSARALEKNGFALEAVHRRHITKFGQTHDAKVYAILKAMDNGQLTMDN
jgi:RimJ/RimL family protein N-acetyltransferase